MTRSASYEWPSGPVFPDRFATDAPRRLLHLGTLAAVSLAALSLLAPAQLAVTAARRRPSRRLALAFHMLLCGALGLKQVLHGAPRASGATLFVANHLSWLDIPALGATLGGAFVAKAEVGRWPVIGTLAGLQPTIFVDRSARSGVRGQAGTIRQQLAAGTDVILFPEGTSSDGRTVLPFKPALLDAVRGLRGVAVQPVTIRYRRLGGIPVTRRTRPLLAWFGDMALLPHLWDLVGEGAIDVDIRLHPAIRVDGAFDRKRLGEACHRAVAAGYHRRSGAAVPEELP
jgi:lyso-ornithine lipid O-acyltransferase